jgi:hypothetical protein
VDKSWVQAIIALLTAVSVITGFFMKLIEPQAFIGLMGVSIGFFFGTGGVASVNNAVNSILAKLNQPK